MKTNFTECKKVNPPKSLRDCYKHDALTASLWAWREAVQKFGLFIFWFIIISGVIISITSAIVVETVTKGTYYTYTDTQTTFNFILFITSLLETALYAILEYFLISLSVMLLSINSKK